MTGAKGFNVRTKGIAALCVALTLMVAGASGAGATGSESIGGFASGTVKYYYGYPRTISNPGTPGPAVAFNQSYGPYGLQLGTHDCYGNNTSTLKNQTPGVWMSVGETLPAGTDFCLRSFSTSGTGNFGGTLAWD